MPRPRSFNRQQTLESCLQVFKRQGFKSTSIDDLVSEAKTNRKMIYDAFRDKENLYLECTRNHYTSESISADNILAARPLGMHNIRAFWDHKVEQIGEESCFTTMIINERNALPDEAVDLAMKSWADFRQLIIKNAEVELSTTKAEELAEAFINALPALGTNARLHGNDPSYLGAADTILRRNLKEIASI